MWNDDGWCIFLLQLLLLLSPPLCVIDFECIFHFQFIVQFFFCPTFTQVEIIRRSLNAPKCSLSAEYVGFCVREIRNTFRKFYFNESGRPQFKMHSFSDQISIPDRPIIPSPARDLVRRQQPPPPPSTTDNLLKPHHHHHNN